MILLDGANKSIEIDLDEAATTELPIVASYVDITTATMVAAAMANSDTTTNDTTAVTAVAAPGAGVTRKVCHLSVYNADNVVHNVTVQLNNNSTLRTIRKAILQVGDTLEYVDGAGWSTLTAHNLAVRGTFSNLVVKNNASHSDHQVDIDADSIALWDGSKVLLVNDVNLTVDVTASGANGLDTGSEADATWYYVYVIAKADGTTAGLLSTNATSPTMPSGYTFKKLVSAVYNVSNDFRPYQQYGARVQYIGYASTWNIANGTQDTGATSLNAAIALLVPPNSIRIEGQWTLTTGDSDVYIYTDNGTSVAAYIGRSTSDSVFVSSEIPLVTAQTIWYKMSDGTPSNAFYASCLGFTLSI